MKPDYGDMTSHPSIKSHHDLAQFIQGKRILLLNSMGKDSVLALSWLSEYAQVEVVSIHFEFLAKDPNDELYEAYLRKRFPSVIFLREPNSVELSLILSGDFQSPLEVLKEYNHYPFEGFYREMQVEDLRKKYACDFVCVGESKYENFARSVKFYQKGLFDQKSKRIYPLGLMDKKQIYQTLKATGLKLHPCYKFSAHTLDHPSYFRMRRALLASRDYQQAVFQLYPLLRLDQYRWENLLHAKN